MSALEKWMLRRLVRKAARQGDHERETEAIFAAIKDAWRREFYEDNDATRTAHLLELWRKA